LNVVGEPYDGRYEESIEELSRAIGRSMKFRTRCPGIQEKFKPQQPDRLEGLLAGATHSLHVKQKCDGWTGYIRAAPGTYREPMARVSFRSDNYYSFLIPVAPHLHGLFVKLDMTLVAEVVAVDERGEDLGYNHVLTVLKMGLSRAPEPGQPRLRVFVFDIASMAGLNRNAFHPYVPRIIDLLVSVGGPLVRAVHTQHFRREGPLFVPAGQTQGLTPQELVRSLLDTARGKAWEGFVVCNPRLLDRAGPSDKAYEVCWDGKTCRDLTQAKCKDLIQLKVAVGRFSCAKERFGSQSHDVFALYTLSDDNTVRYLTNFYANDFMKTTAEVLAVFGALALPDTHRTRDPPGNSVRLFQEAFNRPFELLEPGMAATATVVFTWMSRDLQPSGMKKIVRAEALSGIGQLDLVHNVLGSNRHWMGVLDRSLSLKTFNSNIGSKEVLTLDTEGWEGRSGAGASAKSEAQPALVKPALVKPALVKPALVKPAPPRPAPARAAPPRPAPAPLRATQPAPVRQADQPIINLARACQLCHPPQLLELIRAVYFALFWMCSAIKRPRVGGAGMVEARRNVANILNRDCFFFRPDAVSFLDDHADFTRFIRRDQDNGAYYPEPPTHNCGVEEIQLVLKTLPVPGVMKGGLDPRFETDEGVEEICHLFDEFMALDIVTEESFESMARDFSYNFANQIQQGWEPVAKPPGV
jgi:hypothetical protein